MYIYESQTHLHTQREKKSVFKLCSATTNYKCLIKITLMFLQNRKKKMQWDIELVLVNRSCQLTTRNLLDRALLEMQSDHGTDAGRKDVDRHGCGLTDG